MSLALGAAPLRLVLATYELDGAWAGLQNWTLQLQACGGAPDAAAAWARFGTTYEAACAVGGAALLARADYGGGGGDAGSGSSSSAGSGMRGPRFYDPYVVTDAGALYPIPVSITNRRAPPDQAGAHARRFFFVDGALATPAAGGGPRAVVFPEAMALAFTIRADARDRILPPVLTIT